MNAQRKIVIQFYVLSGLLSFCGLAFVSAIYPTYLLRHGLSLFQMNLVNACYFAALVCMEVPTGAFADLFGRKKAFVIACAMIGLSKLTYCFSTGIAGFIMAELIAAVGFTFQSGAFDAWFVDSMKHAGYDGDGREFFGTQMLVNQICAAFGGLAGGYLFTRDMSLPWFVGSVMMFSLSAYAAIRMREAYFVREKARESTGIARASNIIKTSFRYGRDNQAVRFLLVITFVQVLAVQALNMFWQPFLASRGMPVAYNGPVIFGVMIALGIGGYLVRKSKIPDESRAIAMTQGIAGLLVLIAVVMPGTTLTILFFLMHELPRGAYAPLKQSYLQKNIPSEERATISSFTSIAPHVGGIAGLLMSGAIADRFGMSVAWAVSGVIFMASFLFVKNRKRPVQAAIS
jgi:MFS family permease